MKNPTQTSSDQITFLVFKESLASRTFQIPVSWISRLGLIVCALCFLTFVSLGVAIRNYRLAHLGNPQKAIELERELKEVRTKLETKITELSQSLANAPKVQPSAALAPPADTSAKSQPAPIPAPAPVPAPIVASEYPSLTMLPMINPVPLTPPQELTIEIGQPEAIFKKNSLHVHFSIQYTKTDSGNQQGRIVILAKGPETLMGYPDGLFSTRQNQNSWIDYTKGEYFSVSRFRAVDAEFGPLASADLIKEVEALVFGTEGQLLLIQKIIPTKNGKSKTQSQSPSQPQQPPQENPTQ